MRPALSVLVFLAVIGASGPLPAAPVNRGATPAASQPPRTNPASPDEEDDAPPSAGRTGAHPQAGRGGERRRISYASCNRESHKLNLRGGARRRFLIRCKLGFERKKIGPPRQGEPAPAGRRP